MQRRLSTILAADFVGYSRLMEADEESTVQILGVCRSLIDKHVHDHHGRIFGSAGDSVIVEFTSPIEAVRCAVGIQQELDDRNAGLPDDQQMALRIGINLGDVIVENENLLGDGVNIAARLESIADPGSVFLSRPVFDQIKKQLVLNYEDVGEQRVKNIEEPIHVYKVQVGQYEEKFFNGYISKEPTSRSGRSENVISSADRKLWSMGVGLVLVLLIAVISITNLSNKESVVELPPGPRLAVMPFEPGDPFSNGLTQDLIGSLSKFSTMLVFPQVATGKLQKRGADCETIRDALGANFILSGSVRRTESQLRITANLVNALDCSQLWSEKFDRELAPENLFATTDQVVSTIASMTGSQGPGFENITDIIRTNNPENLDVYDCVLQSQWYWQVWAPEVHKEARGCLEWAVVQEPNYVAGHVNLASLYIAEFRNRLSHRYADSLDRAKRHLETADAIAPGSDNIHYLKALHAYYSECDGYEKFYAAADKAIELNPNNFMVTGDIGNHTAYSGKYERGIELLNRAKLLNPLHPTWIYIVPMLYSYRSGEYDEALSFHQKMSSGMANADIPLTLLAATYGSLGELSKARETIDQLVEKHPQFVEDPRQLFRVRRMEPELIESIMDGLRAAGHHVPPENNANQC